jgi:hypothetical protein
MQLATGARDTSGYCGIPSNSGSHVLTGLQQQAAQACSLFLKGIARLREGVRTMFSPMGREVRAALAAPKEG